MAWRIVCAWRLEDTQTFPNALYDMVLAIDNVLLSIFMGPALKIML